MKNKGLLLTLVGFGAFILVGQQTGLFGSSNPDSFPKLPEQLGFEVAKQYDGTWLGRRVDVTGNNMCERTTITGEIVDGFATLMLTYNGTPLQGWVDKETGELVLYARHRQWDYRFVGKAGKNKIQGKWHLTNGPCKGTWYIEKQS
ncbi:hypothetical protein EJ063_01525 [Vibrio aquaticus]|uniref:Uncharacterized protein n=1 Tax=Vibrio aquaticus TaxID=2496559 RepID=A0A3S0Q390_9VIBR|nr:hypothetical protein [Vibrio aquaticus]RTZ17489.1 hypothetical protein EJ063_01525 [Vibrio aquaticus]